MAIHFDMDRMEQVKQTHAAWWDGTLGRPLTRFAIVDAYPVERKSPAPRLSQATCADFSWTPEQIIETLDEDLSCQEYLGDGFPFVSFDAFGPGVTAAFCGARLDSSSGNVWFFPPEEREIQDIHVRYDPENLWVKRIKSIYRAGLERWNGLVIMGMPDLGGVLDIAATFRGTENLLLDLYDEPDEVKRLIREIHQAWYDAYYDFREVLKPQGVYCDYPGLLSVEPASIIQCDFSFMISNSMFREFVLETLREDTDHLTNVIYHLDGEGELIHLDDILGLEKLKAVQWVYGFQHRGAQYWIPLYKKIMDAGKNVWLYELQDFLCVMENLHGNPYFNHYFYHRDMDLVRHLMKIR